jgi:hypothetical protein
VAAPLTLLGLNVIAAPAQARALNISPVTALQLLAALALWTALFVVPLARILSRLGRRRAVRIEDGVVHLAARGPLRVRHSTLALRAYDGVAHRVRTTMSGTRHEVVLMHANPAQSVLLAVENRISDADVERIARALGLPVVSGRELALSAWYLPVLARRSRDLTEATAT